MDTIKTTNDAQISFNKKRLIRKSKYFEKYFEKFYKDNIDIDFELPYLKNMGETNYIISDEILFSQIINFKPVKKMCIDNPEKLIYFFYTVERFGIDTNYDGVEYPNNVDDLSTLLYIFGNLSYSTVYLGNIYYILINNIIKNINRKCPELQFFNKNFLQKILDSVTSSNNIFVPGLNLFITELNLTLDKKVLWSNLSVEHKKLYSLNEIEDNKIKHNVTTNEANYNVLANNNDDYKNKYAYFYVNKSDDFGVFVLDHIYYNNINRFDGLLSNLRFSDVKAGSVLVCEKDNFKYVSENDDIEKYGFYGKNKKISFTKFSII